MWSEMCLYPISCPKHQKHVDNSTDMRWFVQEGLWMFACAMWSVANFLFFLAFEMWREKSPSFMWCIRNSYRLGISSKQRRTMIVIYNETYWYIDYNESKCNVAYVSLIAFGQIKKVLQIDVRRLRISRHECNDDDDNDVGKDNFAECSHVLNHA